MSPPSIFIWTWATLQNGTCVLDNFSHELSFFVKTPKPLDVDSTHLRAFFLVHVKKIT